MIGPSGADRSRATSRWLCCLCMLVALACSESRSLDNDILSDLLSLGAVVRTPIADTANPELIAGLIIDTTVIHTGFIMIDVPFRMRWALRRDGSTLASATRDFEAGFRPGDSLPVRLTIRFDPVSSLSGIGDAVTFDLLGEPSPNLLGE